MLCLAIQLTAHAHLMAVDRATLNFRDGGAFMVLSLPPTSFAGINLDDDGDGFISNSEFLNHQGQLQQAISQKVQLSDDQGPLSLEGIFVSFESSHDPSSEQPSIIALGKFALRSGLTPTHWSIGLWGLQSKSNAIEAKVTSQGLDGVVLKNQSLTFKPSKRTHRLFPSFVQQAVEFAWIIGVMIFLMTCLLLLQKAKVHSDQSTAAVKSLY